MAENTELNPQVEDVKEGEAAPVKQDVQPSYSEAEQRALEQGWRPKEEWDGDPEDWKSAKEFLRAGELYSKIEEQNRRIKSMDATQKALAKHLEEVRKNEFQRAINTLKAERKQALADGDADRVVEVEDQMARAHAEHVEAEKKIQQAAQPQEVTQDPVVQVWVNRNPWYASTPKMKAFADEVGSRLVAAGERDTKAILLEVERRTKKEFPEYFNNPRRSAPSSVEGGGNKGGKSEDHFELTPAERQVMHKFVKAGVMSEKEYIADIKAQRTRERGA